MIRLAILTTTALLLALTSPASAQQVITNPGWCAQFYPNANCQNLGPGNPYTSYGWQQPYGSQQPSGWQQPYGRAYNAYPRRPHYYRHRY